MTAPDTATKRADARGRRWLRAAIPFAVALALIVVSTVAYQLQQVDPTDPDFLSPTSNSAIGGAKLAHLLAAKGVEVQRYEHSSDALVSANRGDATLFISAPGLVHPYYLRMLKLLPDSTTVVLVAPGERDLAGGLLPVGVPTQRLATGVTAPDCQQAAALAAGPSATRRVSYALGHDVYARQRYSCYRGSLLGFAWHSTQLVVVGANDPFRNDRIDEAGNSALATGLLSGTRRVVWLDLHRAEPPPGIVNEPQASRGPGELNRAAPTDPDFPVQSGSPADQSGTGGNAQSSGDTGSGNSSGSGSNGGKSKKVGSSLWNLFPPWVWAMFALLMIGGVLLALALGRRLGVPIGEPLPVTVPAAETVHGRGRLYQRANARTAAAQTLRTAARNRLTELLDLPADTADDTLADAIAARTGRSSDEVLAALSRPLTEVKRWSGRADADAELVSLASVLDALPHELAQPSQAQPVRMPDRGDKR